MIVEDEQDIAHVLKRGLELKGFTVDVFTDPLEALSNFRAGSYGLILSDIKMPKMNGFELYHKIEKMDPVVKICFITAFEMYYDEFKRVFPKIKVSCFVRKPVSINDLANIIVRELGLEEQLPSFDRRQS